MKTTATASGQKVFGANRTCVDAASQKAASLAQGAAKQDALLRSAGLSPAASPLTSQLQSEFLWAAARPV